jgi:hypothetical protein
MQEDDDGQATPTSSLFGEPGGFGVGWMLQVWPFHRSTKVVFLPEALTA